jgi:hypothetical protein
MDIDDIISYTFTLSSHWDLRRAPEVCKKWRNIYYKKKMILGWQAFEAGDVYGIYRTPYYPVETYYLAAIGGHYDIAKYFAGYIHGPDVSTSRVMMYIDSLMFRRCDPAIIMLMYDGYHSYCRTSSYKYGHIAFIKALQRGKGTIPDMISGVLKHSMFYVSVLLEHFSEEEITTYINTTDMTQCMCGITGKINTNHDVRCGENKLFRGQEPETSVYSANYTSLMTPIFPLLMNKLIYESYKLHNSKFGVHMYIEGYSDSLEFIFEKLCNGDVYFIRNCMIIPSMLIKVYEKLPEHREYIKKNRELEKSMQGIEFMIANNIKVQRDNRYPPLITSTYT